MNMFFECLLFCRNMDDFSRKDTQKRLLLLFRYSLILKLYFDLFFLTKFKKPGKSHVWNITDSKASFMRVSDRINIKILTEAMKN